MDERPEGQRPTGVPRNDDFQTTLRMAPLAVTPALSNHNEAVTAEKDLNFTGGEPARPSRH